MAIGEGDSDPTNTPGGAPGTYSGAGDVPIELRRVATGYGESAGVAGDIMRQNLMNSWQNNFMGGLPMSMAVGNTGLNQNFGLGRTGVIGGEGGGTQIDPRIAGGVLGGSLGFMLGGPGGAYAGYQAGSYLGGRGGGNSDPAYLGGSSAPGLPGSPGSGGTGLDPNKPPPGGQIAYGGGGANAEADRLLTRSNLIGDAWRNTYGDPNAQRMQGLAGQYSSLGNVYAGAGGQQGQEATLHRLNQMGYGDAAAGAGAGFMGQADWYAGRGDADYARQAALGGQQQQNANMAGAAAGGMFGKGQQYGAAAQGDAASAAGARQGQAAYGALGGGYGSSQMGTSQGLLGGAAQDYQNQQGSRTDAQGAIGRLRSFYEQGPGPSAAQAQLQQSSEANMSNALALARSGRGAGANASAMRQAQFQNAATQQQTGQQMAQLRAQEAATWRGQQLGAMGQEQSALGNLRGQDLGAMGQNLGAAAQFGGLGYQGIGLGAGQANQMRGQDITSQGQNIGAQQGMYGLGFQGLGQQQSGLQGARGQDLSAYGANIGAQQGMGALGYQGYGMGLSAAQGAGSQALTSQGQNQQTGLGYANIGQGYNNIGLQNQLGYASMANQQYQSGDSLRAQILNAQLQSDTARYGADRGVQVGMAQLAAQEKAALIGAVGAGIGALSDIRAKKNIKAKPFNGLLGDLFGKGDDEDAAPAPAPPKAAPQYLNPYGAPPPPGGQFGTMAVNMPGAQQPPLPGNPAQDLAMQGLNVPVGSDERGKKEIHRLGELAGGGSGADLRPAKGYSYEYKNPSSPGAAPGEHFGPMSKDLRKTPAGRSVVSVNPETGMDQIDTDRLSLVNTSAISEQQRRLDRLEQMAGGKVASDERSKKRKRSMY